MSDFAGQYACLIGTRCQLLRSRTKCMGERVRFDQSRRVGLKNGAFAQVFCCLRRLPERPFDELSKEIREDTGEDDCGKRENYQPAVPSALSRISIPLWN